MAPCSLLVAKVQDLIEEERLTILSGWLLARLRQHQNLSNLALKCQERKLYTQDWSPSWSRWHNSIRACCRDRRWGNDQSHYRWCGNTCTQRRKLSHCWGANDNLNGVDRDRGWLDPSCGGIANWYQRLSHSASQKISTMLSWLQYFFTYIADGVSVVRLITVVVATFRGGCAGNKTSVTVVVVPLTYCVETTVAASNVTVA